MATNSILKNVTIRDRKMGRDFVYAIENASRKKSPPVVISKAHMDVKGNDILKMSGEKPNDGI